LALSAALRDKSVSKILFRALNQIKLLSSAGSSVQISPIEDPAIASWMMLRKEDDFSESISLASLMQQHQVMHAVPGIPAWPSSSAERAAWEAAGAWILQQKLRQGLQEHRLLDRFPIEMDATHALAHIEWWGIGFDLVAWNQVVSAI